MASRYNLLAAGRVPDLIERSDSEELDSVSEGEPTQQDLNDHRLAQAANYLQQEGANDSPATFISRVNRIDVAILQSLPQQGRNYDQELYCEVHGMVRNIQREYKNAAEIDSTPIQSEEEALYREEESPTPLPRPAPCPAHPKSKALTSRRPGDEEDVEREREFRYGGPHNELEYWHKDFPASLPFPETLLMAHWESLKIDYDLARSNQDTIVETIVPFDHALLKSYFELSPYESGSRFKLPPVKFATQRSVRDYGHDVQAHKIIKRFNDGQDLKEYSEKKGKDYAPRVFLDKVQISHHQLPNELVKTTQIRRSINTTPSKPRVSSMTAEVSTPLASSPPSLSKSAAFRRLQSGINDSLEPVRRVATGVHISSPPRRARPLQNPQPAPLADDYAQPTALSLKRKASAGALAYTPPASSLKKKVRSAKRAKVAFVDQAVALEQDSDDPRFAASPVLSPKPRAAKKTKSYVSKAKAAGKQVSKARTKVSEREISLPADEYTRQMKKKGRKNLVAEAESARRGTTRSGTKFK